MTKIKTKVQTKRKQHLNHINRIEGQLKALKKYMADDTKHSCIDIALLTTSIAKSFDSLRLKTLEGFIANELLAGKKVPKTKIAQLHQLIKLYQK